MFVALFALLTRVAAPAFAQPAPVILIGVDGMEWSVIEKLQAEGSMPAIKALRERGVSAKLATDYGAASPIVWTTVATGMNKEVHGITDFAITTATGTSPVSSTMRKVPAIWNMASSQKRRALVLGWWGSWPAESIDGVIITDRAVKPVEKAVSPPEYEPLFKEEMKRANADKELFPLDEDAGAEDRMVTYFATRYADRKFALTMAYLHGIDLVCHKYWKYWEPSSFKDVDSTKLAKEKDRIPGKYRAIDAAIGRIVKAASNANILVVSDHGFGPLPEEFVKVSLDLDTVFEQLGMLTRAGKDVDQAKSKVFVSDSAFFMMDKAVRFGSTVTDKAAARADITAKLAKVTYDTGSPVFAVRDAKAHEKKGDFMVQVLPAGASMSVRIDGKPVTGVVKELVQHSGGHGWLPPGVFIAAGPDINAKADLKGIRIHDITPTLLYGMGLPVAADFNGKAFTGLYSSAFQTANPLKTIPTYGKTGDSVVTPDETDAEMLEQLRALGYIK